MHAPPFHRRILPWVFGVSFLAVAPAVLFYTAGYRYNAKKGQIERNGTVIIETRPTRADIVLDGRGLTDRTPITLQNMPPGNHQFDLKKAGYTTWTKTLDVRPELVTFLNAVRLWKVTEPVPFSTGTVDLVSLAPNDDYLLILSTTPTAAYQISDLRGAVSMSGKLQPAPGGKLRAVWHPDGSAVLLESDTGPSWLIDAGRSHQAMQLPEAEYHFSKTELVGNDGKGTISIRLGDLAVRRSPLNGLVDAGDAVDLRNATGTHALAMISSDAPDQGVILPDGNWRIALEDRNYTILRDGSKWLSVQGSVRPPTAHRSSGDLLRPLTLNRHTNYLMVDGSELWLWDPLHDPELLRRQSEPIVNAVWHYAGTDVFYATDKDVYALNLDPRDGYFMTKLASFDKIKDIAASTAGVVYVAGSKEGVEGVWTLVTE